MNGELHTEYARRYETVLRQVAESLRQHVASHISDMPRVDRITARAKTPASFIEKAEGTTDNGERRYADPLSEVQDIIGVRIIVFYKNDVETAVEIVRRYFRAIEQKHKVPESQWSFGYFGVHLILALPEDIIPEGHRDDLPEFFELQIKTLFQHAWSEAEHDLGYKPIEDLTPEQQRRLAFAAAQAWGADREFMELYGELA